MADLPFNADRWAPAVRAPTHSTIGRRDRFTYVTYSVVAQAGRVRLGLPTDERPGEWWVWDIVGETSEVAVRTWADDWEQRRAGVACQMCDEGRPDIDDNGNCRFFVGVSTDAYLHRDAPQTGYTTVRWRGRHVPDLSDMTEAELVQFWREVATVAHSLTEAFEPCHLNYELLGNLVPHVHVHIVPRYIDDPCPHTPLKPWVLHRVADEDLRYQTQWLRTALRDA